MKFSRFVYGLLVLVAYLIQDKYLILLVAILTLLGAVSMSLNIPYQIHKSFQNDKSAGTSPKDFGEISFVSGATGMLVLIGYLLLEFTDYASLAWIYLLIVDAMIFLACLVGFCAATLMYIFIRNKFNHKSN